MQGTADVLEVGTREIGAELPDPIEDIDRLEIVPRAAGVDESAGIETKLLEDDECDAPLVLGDDLPAAPAARAPGRRALGAMDVRNPAMLDAEAGGGDQRVRCLDRKSTRLNSSH